MACEVHAGMLGLPVLQVVQAHITWDLRRSFYCCFLHGLQAFERIQSFGDSRAYLAFTRVSGFGVGRS